MKTWKRYFIACSLLLLFTGYWSSITLFPHAHRIGGYVYVHSHPFSSTSQHEHTPQQLQLIEQLSLYLATVVSVSFGIEIFRKLLYTFYVTPTIVCQSEAISWYGLRAPPAC